MLSQTTEYALRAIVYLADHPEGSHTAEVISRGTQVSVGYLAKILQTLGKAGLVVSQRGLHGGFSLTRSPRDITIYDVVQAIDPIVRITTCPLGDTDHGLHLCPLHRGIDNALQAVETTFRKITIHQVLNQPQTSRPLCKFPRLPAAVER